jgi:hypothetical protein
MPHCPSCGRPVALTREACLDCGVALPAGLVPAPPSLEASRPACAPTAGEEPSSPPRDRVLLVIDLGGASPDALARGLGLSAYEAALLARRGGFHLHAILGEPAATKARLRLEDEELRVDAVPEAEARLRPVPAGGGERERERLHLHTEEGALTLAGEDLLIVVRGPIARQLKPPEASSLARVLAHSSRGTNSPSLEEGYRVHLHRRLEPRPLEIDPANFEFGFAPHGSARLEIEDWLLSLGPGVPRDDGFRWLPPALGVAGPEARTALSAVGRLSRAARGNDPARTGEAVVLDNTEQFRFYSGWRGAIERRRAAVAGA